MIDNEECGRRMNCKKCGNAIIVACIDDGSVRIFNKPKRGFISQHYCGSYVEILSKSMIKKLGLELNAYG